MSRRIKGTSKQNLHTNVHSISRHSLKVATTLKSICWWRLKEVWHVRNGMPVSREEE